MLVWVRPLCGERSWERQELGVGTSSFQSMRGFPRLSPLACQQGPKKIFGRVPGSLLPLPAQEVARCCRHATAPARALLGPRYFFHWVHVTGWTPPMGRSCLTFQSSQVDGEGDLTSCIRTKWHSPQLCFSRIWGCLSLFACTQAS